MLVAELESGDLPLDQAMKKFEDGIKLTRSCQTALQEAEQKVAILLKTADGVDELEDLKPGTSALRRIFVRARMPRPYNIDNALRVCATIALQARNQERRNTLLNLS